MLLTATAMAVPPTLHAQATEAPGESDGAAPEAAPPAQIGLPAQPGLHTQPGLPAQPVPSVPAPSGLPAQPVPSAPAPSELPAPAPAPSEIDALLAFLDRLVVELPPLPLPLVTPTPLPFVPPGSAALVAAIPVTIPAIVPVPEPVQEPEPEPAAMLRPVPGQLMRGFGMDGDHDHKGLDIDGEEGDPILAARSGTVVDTSCGSGYGICTVVDHGHGVVTWYAHLSEQTVTGGPVARGEVIGLMGCTGSCTGSHLHFEVHVDGTARDPQQFL